ncbi:MAG: hypothetical protein U1G07_08770 [Verrucomicrobiota bacterium]
MHVSHLGAWPADVFYGDMEGLWTDELVNERSAEDPRNFNVPGDGKFDQTQIPGLVSLQVGRVDLFDLPAFTPLSETDLLRRYLRKNHDFRHKVFQAERRALIRDNFGEISGDAPATDAWRTFAPFFGSNAVQAVPPGQFFPSLAQRSYLWAYGGGGGGYFQADSVGSTTDFAQQSPQCVFYMLHGSYFGDWDATDDLLRAALATPGYGLAAAWTGLPHWFLHPMALGETIGLCTVLVQNNRDLYKNQVNLSTNQVHIALMGDPTLRMHVVAPPGRASARAQADRSVALDWSPSPDSVLGYYVYRASSLSGPFARLNRALITTTAFTDVSPAVGHNVYMLRAVNLERSGSGTYYNPSQGAFAEVEVIGQTNQPPAVSALPDQHIPLGGAIGPIPFTVADPDTALDQLMLSADSSNPGLVPAESILFSGQGAARTVQLTPVPGRDGVATITITVSDGTATATQSFQLTVEAPARIDSIRRQSDGAVVIQFEGGGRRSYTIQGSKDFIQWTPLGSGMLDTNAAAIFLDNQTTTVCRFYRVEWQ